MQMVVGEVTYFSDDECGEAIWTANYPGSIHYEYLSYAGSASNAYFLHAQGPQTYSDYTPIYHKMQCSGVGLQDYPVQGMGTKNIEVKGNFKWAYAAFYENENVKVLSMPKIQQMLVCCINVYLTWRA